jgi:hypothetical protein
MPPCTGFSGTQFSTLKSDGINDSKGPDNTEVKYGAFFFQLPPSTWHLLGIYKYIGMLFSSQVVLQFSKRH